MNKQQVSIEIQRIENEARKNGNAVADINGQTVVCRCRVQTRNGRRTESTYYTMNGNRIKFEDLMQQLNDY